MAVVGRWPYRRVRWALAGFTIWAGGGVGSLHAGLYSNLGNAGGGGGGGGGNGGGGGGGQMHAGQMQHLQEVQNHHHTVCEFSNLSQTGSEVGRTNVNGIYSEDLPNIIFS